MPRRKTEPALPARFHIKPNALSDFQVAILDFPFQEAIDQFVGGMQQLLRVDELEYHQRPPYRLLSNAISACAPTLVHAFEKVGWDRQTGRDIRQMLVADINACPTEEQIAYLVRMWARYWARNTEGIKDQIDGEGKALYDQLIANLGQPQTEWLVRDISGLIENLDDFSDLNREYGLSFRAVPSLLAERLHSQTSRINNRTIRWRKVQDGTNGLFVVSQPFKSSYIDKYGHAREGFFAYKLELKLHTQAGQDRPWIHLFVRCQRYAHEPLVAKNYNRDMSILMGMNKERLTDWKVDTALVQLGVTGKLERVQWRDNLAGLLADLKARPLVDFSDIRQQPTAHWNLTAASDNDEDEYYIVHAEGYKYGESEPGHVHEVKTGFSLKERSEIVAQVAHLLRDILEPDDPLTPDAVELPSGQKRLWATRDFEDISRSPTLDKRQRERLGLTTDEAYRQELERRTRARRVERQPRAAEAVRRPLNHVPVQIVILWSDSDTRDALYRQVRDLFLLNDGDDFPEGIVVNDWPIPDHLHTPLDAGNLDPQTNWLPFKQRPKGFKQQWQTQMKRAHLSKMDDWRKFLQTLPPFKGYQLALIQTLRREEESGFHHSQGIKGAIRDACARENFASQLIGTAQFTTDKDTGAVVLKPESKGRIQNAVCDLILRQVGGLYELPTEIYRAAGLEPETADHLTVLALGRIYSRKADISYPLAVRLLPGGEMQALLPEKNSQLMTQAKWIPYVEAGPAIGRVFAQARKDKFVKDKRPYSSKVKYSPKQLAAFAAHVLTKRTEGPTLALIEAEGWRNHNVWPQLKNENMVAAKNTLDFRGIDGYDIYTPEDVPGLRVVRLRMGEETPQYVVTDRVNWNEIDESRDFGHLAGFIDRQVDGLLHYFSIGKLPETKRRDQDTRDGRGAYKTDEGGGIAFQHQQMVEHVLFFEQSEDDTDEKRAAWCRIAHFLRSSPAWTVGNITLAYPLHLGKTVVKDQICILGFGD